MRLLFLYYFQECVFVDLILLELIITLIASYCYYYSAIEDSNVVAAFSLTAYAFIVLLLPRLRDIAMLLCNTLSESHISKARERCWVYKG